MTLNIDSIDSFSNYNTTYSSNDRLNIDLKIAISFRVQSEVVYRFRALFEEKFSSTFDVFEYEKNTLRMWGLLNLQDSKKVTNLFQSLLTMSDFLRH